MKPEVTLRIVVIDPPSEVLFALQKGRDELVAPVASTGGALVFEFPVSVADATSEPPRFTGGFAQGPAGGRFVYINSGTAAGHADSRWSRRAKIPLAGISRSLLQSALDDNGCILETRIAGIARDGGPACAAVPLPGGWVVAGDRSQARQGNVERSLQDVGGLPS